jgi:hypothetical protein
MTRTSRLASQVALRELFVERHTIFDEIPDTGSMTINKTKNFELLPYSVRFPTRMPTQLGLVMSQDATSVGREMQSTALFIRFFPENFEFPVISLYISTYSVDFAQVLAAIVQSRCAELSITDFISWKSGGYSRHIANEPTTAPEHLENLTIQGNLMFTKQYLPWMRALLQSTPLHTLDIAHEGLTTQTWMQCFRTANMPNLKECYLDGSIPPNAVSRLVNHHASYGKL